MNELPELDFGEIHGYIPDECCIKEEEPINNNDIIANFVLFAYDDEKDECGMDRKFTVNLHRDGSWSFTFTNGEPLNDEQISNYCSSITGAQNKLMNERKWKLNGRGLGIWDTNKLAGTDGSIQDTNTNYLNQGSYKSNCSIFQKVNL